MAPSGLSRARLARMHKVMAAHVERGVVPGLATLISRRGEVHVDTIGSSGIGSSPPMRRDTIFRISSMTKPIVALAAMILVEECKVRLDEPVDQLLPELADRRVLRSWDGPLDDTVPADRPITLRDLLTFRMGTGLAFAPDASAVPILRAIRDHGLGLGPPKPSEQPEPDEWMRRLGSLPLMCQPGERWMYNTAYDVLGVLIARASGQPLGTFLHECIFDPLGMRDTGFSAPPESLDRLAVSYDTDPETGALVVYDPALGGEWSRPPAFPSGAAGLVSTLDDYLAFGQMMLDKGRHGKERILSRPTVELMTTDQLTPEQKAVSGFYPGYFDSRGWGFGVCVVTRRDDVSAVPGRFGWDGGLGTSWFSDPREDLVGVLMTQRLAFPQFSEIYLDFWTSVYQAIDD